MDDWDQPRLDPKERNFGFIVRSLRNFSELLGDRKTEVLVRLLILLVCQAIVLIVPCLFKLIFDELPNCLARGEASTTLIVSIVAFSSLQLGNVILMRIGVKWPMTKLVIFFENHWPVIAQAKLMSLSPGFHERENTGKKISKIEKGCDKLLQILMESFWSFLPQALYLVINMALIAFFDWRLGLTIIVPVVVCIIVDSKVFAGFYPMWEAWEAQKEKSSGLLTQSLVNIRTVQAFVQEKREMERFSGLRAEMRDLDYSFSKQAYAWFISLNLILNAAYVSCILLGIYLAFRHEITVGTVVFVVATGSVSIQSIIQLVEMYNQLLRKFVTVNRLKTLLDEQPELNDTGAALPEGAGEIRVNQVSFKYPNKEHSVLEDFSLAIGPKEMVALVSRSGKGKTTLAKLICRSYDVTSGEILFEGADIRTLSLYDYRRLFAIVQQDVDIFDGTLRENVVYPYPDATPAEVDEAIRAAYLDSLCENKESMPKGIDTQVGERGVKLSGGERQRVGIARAYIALLHGARFLVLDEATSNLDSEAERAIQEMIGKLRERLNISIIVIAHRLSTIKLADKICVINDGRVEELGDHAQLMKQNGLYSSLVELQRLGSLRD